MFPMARDAWVAGELKPVARAILVASRVVIRPPDFRPCLTMASWRVRSRERGIWMPCWRQRPRSSSRDSDGVRRTCPGSDGCRAAPRRSWKSLQVPGEGAFQRFPVLGVPRTLFGPGMPRSRAGAMVPGGGFEAHDASELGPSLLGRGLGMSWSSRIFMLYFSVDLAGHVLKRCPDLPFLHPGEPVQELLYGGSLGQVSEQC